MIIDWITETNKIEYYKKLLELERLTLEEVTEQRNTLRDLHNKNAARSAELLELCGTLRKERDRLAEAIRKHRDELELTSGDSVDRILWNVLDAVEGGSDE